MNNSNDSMSFIALNKLKHKTYKRSVSQVELKVTDFTLLDAHNLPIHGTAWRVLGVCGLHQCVCATSSLGIRIELPLKSYSLCIYLGLIQIIEHWLKSQIDSNYHLSHHFPNWGWTLYESIVWSEECRTKPAWKPVNIITVWYYLSGPDRKWSKIPYDNNTRLILKWIRPLVNRAL